MIGSITIPDPTAVLLLTHLRTDEVGRAYAGPRADLTRRQRRHQRHARLRKLLG
ncbi:hypothetical protein [Nocardioides sp.]|uniref:hypothetical protein n=1 Tax=Nocardioides sp. TaxID=35761 RepID=UPI002ED880CE